VKRFIVCLLFVLSLCAVSVAQEGRHEFTVQGSGFFTKETTNSGITNSPTYSGGFLAGYRYNLTKWIGVEADYDYFRSSQKYFKTAGLTYVPTNTHAVTGSAVIKFPVSKVFKPYALVGGGEIFFNPRDSVALDKQARGTFVYGGGVDVPLMKHIALRGQYRGFVYKVPDFKKSQMNLDSFTHTAVPSLGFVFTF
jgi:opacity protein-like surface antigen